MDEYLDADGRKAAMATVDAEMLNGLMLGTVVPSHTPTAAAREERLVDELNTACSIRGLAYTAYCARAGDPDPMTDYVIACEQRGRLLKLREIPRTPELDVARNAAILALDDERRLWKARYTARRRGVTNAVRPRSPLLLNTTCAARRHTVTRGASNNRRVARRATRAAGANAPPGSPDGDPDPAGGEPRRLTGAIQRCLVQLLRRSATASGRSLDEHVGDIVAVGDWDPAGLLEFLGLAAVASTGESV